MSVKRHHYGRICIVPRVAGVGGMVSFQQKLIAGSTARGVDVTQNLKDRPYQSVLVVGGTRDLSRLLRARHDGIPIVQRLDGMNWLHRLTGARRAGLQHYVRSEYGNFILGLIRNRIANKIVYQSEFARSWWEQTKGPSSLPIRVIYNGVDLSLFTPDGPEKPPKEFWRVLMVEGSLMGGYELGLAVAVRLVEQLSTDLTQLNLLDKPHKIELMIAGRAPDSIRKEWERRIDAAALKPMILINWLGVVPHQQIPSVDRAAHFLYASDIHPACPNSVIEALACGLPVVSFNTGALAEIVKEGSGRIVPYGGDSWRLDNPDVDTLAKAALEVLFEQQSFRAAARRRAVEAFGLDQMVAEYLDMLT